MQDEYRCVSKKEREQFNKAIAREQTCMSEEDIRVFVEERNALISWLKNNAQSVTNTQ